MLHENVFEEVCLTLSNLQKKKKNNSCFQTTQGKQVKYN